MATKKVTFILLNNLMDMCQFANGIEEIRSVGNFEVFEATKGKTQLTGVWQSIWVFPLCKCIAD